MFRTEKQVGGSKIDPEMVKNRPPKVIEIRGIINVKNTRIRAFQTGFLKRVLFLGSKHGLFP